VVKRTQASGEPQIENDAIIVTRWDFAAGAETGHHFHAYPNIVVPLTDGKVMIEDATGNHQGEMRRGRSYARPAGIAHNVINAGTEPLSFVEIELKQQR
jgi:quercetin dioxygenase-like cupin family protein